MQGDFQYVGRVKGILRYPVKSMRGEALPQAQVGWHGIDGDRRFAFIKTGSLGDFPWLTGREVPDMLRYSPRWLEPASVETSAIVVTTPAGVDLPLASAALWDELTRLWGHPAHLIHLGKGCHDSMPLSFLSTASAESLGQQVGRPLDPRRFRPNVLVELADGQPFGEDRWLGSAIQIGEGPHAARVRIDRRNVRCAMTNIDPDTAERDPRVLKTIVRARGERLGLYGSTQQPGLIRLDDPIYQWMM